MTINWDCKNVYTCSVVQHKSSAIKISRNLFLPEESKSHFHKRKISPKTFQQLSSKFKWKWQKSRCQCMSGKNFSKHFRLFSQERNFPTVSYFKFSLQHLVDVFSSVFLLRKGIEWRNVICVGATCASYCRELCWNEKGPADGTKDLIAPWRTYNGHMLLC